MSVLTLRQVLHNLLTMVFAAAKKTLPVFLS